MITYGVYSPIYFVTKKCCFIFLNVALLFPVLLDVHIHMYLIVNVSIILDVCYPWEL